uniref:Uncharacterized protein n=1 Tax=Anguilla anguilla TaxID=7936 RepID=A0A0E9PTN7_ANGAN
MISWRTLLASSVTSLRADFIYCMMHEELTLAC